MTDEDLEATIARLQGRVAVLEAMIVVLLQQAGGDQAGRDKIAESFLSALREPPEGFSGPFAQGFAETALDIERKLRGG